MNRGRLQLALWLVLTSLAPLSLAADLLDRIVALVNQQPILLSDWEDTVRFDAMQEGRSLESVTRSQKQEALERLIDEQLVLQQTRPQVLVLKSELDRRMSDLRRQIPEANSAAGWRNLLSRYALTEEQVRSRLAAQLDMMRFVESQIIPGIRIENRFVFSYYRNTLTPRLRGEGEPVPPLEDVSSKIREILTQQRTDELFQDWLRTARAQNNIRILPPAASPGDGVDFQSKAPLEQSKDAKTNWDKGAQ